MAHCLLSRTKDFWLGTCILESIVLCCFPFRGHSLEVALLQSLHTCSFRGCKFGNDQVVYRRFWCFAFRWCPSFLLISSWCSSCWVSYLVLAYFCWICTTILLHMSFLVWFLMYFIMVGLLAHVRFRICTSWHDWCVCLSVPIYDICFMLHVLLSHGESDCFLMKVCDRTFLR